MASALATSALTTLLWAVIGNIWMVVVYVGILWSPLEQGLHDKAAGTIVVRAVE